MLELQNRALKQLRSGQLAVGVGLRQARTVDIAKAMRTAGYDWLFIDMEHNSMNIDTAVQICLASHDAGVSPIVRVPGYEHYHATRVLDGGALGIVVPHIDNSSMAKQVASNCLYPPMGHRSITGALPQLAFESIPVRDATEIINRETLIVVMLESPKAIENASEIAAVDGIDVLLIGTNDLCLEMGIPGELEHPNVADAFKSVINACRDHGKFAGMGGVYKPSLMRIYIEMGIRFILAGTDFAFLMESASRQANTVREMLS